MVQDGVHYPGLLRDPKSRTPQQSCSIFLVSIFLDPLGGLARGGSKCKTSQRLCFQQPAVSASGAPEPDRVLCFWLARNEGLDLHIIRSSSHSIFQVWWCLILILRDARRFQNEFLGELQLCAPEQDILVSYRNHRSCSVRNLTM